MNKPLTLPNNPNFSSGPCAKRPNWSVDILKNAAIGRSHRSSIGKAKLQEVITKSREILQIPDDYRIGIVPASDTGAVEMALWSLLGDRPVDIFAWESFGSGWAIDILNQLKLDDVTLHEAEYGKLPNMAQANKNHDIIFTYNGTTSGVKVKNLDFIENDREGLSICDATSAVFATKIDWKKLDVITYSWQKALGSEGGHGMIILSPKAVAKLENFTPNRPLPKIFRLTKKNKLIEGIFKGETINTPSMIAVEDVLDALNWCDKIGGLDTLIARSNANLQVIEDWVEKTDWVEFLCTDKNLRSNTSICLILKNIKPAEIKEMIKILDKEDAGYDIGAYRDAPPGLRIWGGATVETDDIKALLPWLDWAYETVKK